MEILVFGGEKLVEKTFRKRKKAFLRQGWDLPDRLVEKYDDPETLLVISSYPERGRVHGGKVGGIGSFCKNTVRHMNRQTVVVAESFGGIEAYEEGRSLVVRAFKKNSPRMWWQILRVLNNFTNLHNVLIQFDFALYGSMVTSAFFLPFLLVMRWRRYRIHVVPHSVVTDVFKLAGHLGIENNWLGKIKGTIYNLIFKAFYFFLGLLAEKVILTEPALQKQLRRLVGKEDLVSIAHGVEAHKKPIPKRVARRKLGLSQDEFVVMFFGFVNWFKGADFFVKAYHDQKKLDGKGIRFVLAGGKSATLAEQNYYQEYFEKIEKNLATAEKVEMTGFVPQKKIPLYFGAADLVVFPYRYFMSASGPMALVFAYQKAFLVSKNLREMFKADDFKAAFEEADLEVGDVSFALNNKDCWEKTKEALEHTKKVEMARLATTMKQKRDWRKIAAMYDQLIFAPEFALGDKPAFLYVK